MKTKTQTASKQN